MDVIRERLPTASPSIGAAPGKLPERKARPRGLVT
jgi:hypothetical protein